MKKIHYLRSPPLKFLSNSRCAFPQSTIKYPQKGEYISFQEGTTDLLDRLKKQTSSLVCARHTHRDEVFYIKSRVSLRIPDLQMQCLYSLSIILCHITSFVFLRPLGPDVIIPDIYQKKGRSEFLSIISGDTTVIPGLSWDLVISIPSLKKIPE